MRDRGRTSAELRPISLPNKIRAFRRSQVGCHFCKRSLTSSRMWKVRALAQFVQQQLVAHTQAINRGTKAEQFYVLANVRHPAVLVEGGFLTNKNEIGKLADANYREQLAVAISDGILKYRDTIKASSDK